MSFLRTPNAVFGMDVSSSGSESQNSTIIVSHKEEKEMTMMIAETSSTAEKHDTEKVSAADEKIILDQEVRVDCVEKVVMNEAEREASKGQAQNESHQSSVEDESNEALEEEKDELVKEIKSSPGQLQQMCTNSTSFEKIVFPGQEEEAKKMKGEGVEAEEMADCRKRAQSSTSSSSNSSNSPPPAKQPRRSQNLRTAAQVAKLRILGRTDSSCSANSGGTEQIVMKAPSTAPASRGSSTSKLKIASRASPLLHRRVHKEHSQSTSVSTTDSNYRGGSSISSSSVSATSSSDTEKGGVGGGNGGQEGSCGEKNDCPHEKCCELCKSKIETNSNYFHISRLEHLCQNCYEDFRIGKPGWERYVSWKGRWAVESRCAPSLRLYIAEELLPYWLQCRRCARFRSVYRHDGEEKLSAEFVFEFECSKWKEKENEIEKEKTLEGDEIPAKATSFPADPCMIPEEKVIKEVRSNPAAFIKSLFAAPLLHHSPAAYFLREHYYCDEVGLSPLHSTTTFFQFSKLLEPKKEQEEEIKEEKFDEDYVGEKEAKEKRKTANKEEKWTDFMSPFNIPGEQTKAFSHRPDMMEYDEVHAFPEYAIEAVPYLAIRNLIAALWSLNPAEYLDIKRCLTHLHCPGLARIWYGDELLRILNYLTMKQVINYGILRPIPRHVPLLVKEKIRPPEVVIVGGGISGLGAARQLRQMGAHVTVLEAKTKLGGRMQDDWSLGVAVGCGAQLITGVMNNPIVLMCRQIGLDYRILSDECPLIDSVTGRLISSVADRVVDEHFNCILDVIGEWKEGPSPDKSLGSQINGLHEGLIKHLDFKWAKEFERVFQWQIGNVEFSCGAKLDEVSAKHWDQNENVGQFAGHHALLSEGSGTLIKRLAEGIEIRCGHQVESIDWSSDRVFVECTNGKQFTADKVILCLPLTVYQKETIKFTPELPREKRRAFQSLGVGLIEKVAVRFPRRFWTSMLKKEENGGGEVDFFGNVPEGPEKRGLFNMFYDFSARGSIGAAKKRYVLMSYVCGDSVELVNDKPDVEVVKDFVRALRALYPDVDIPDPIGHVVTHWGRDPHIGMSYSYIKTGATGADYDAVGAPIANRLYFAGECTNRHFPQTMTGAYVSALREASRLTEHWIAEQQQNRDHNEHSNPIVVCSQRGRPHKRQKKPSIIPSQQPSQSTEATTSSQAIAAPIIKKTRKMKIEKRKKKHVIEDVFVVSDSKIIEAVVNSGTLTKKMPNKKTKIIKKKKEIKEEDVSATSTRLLRSRTTKAKRVKAG